MAEGPSSIRPDLHSLGCGAALHGSIRKGGDKIWRTVVLASNRDPAQASVIHGTPNVGPAFLVDLEMGVLGIVDLGMVDLGMGVLGMVDLGMGILGMVDLGSWFTGSQVPLTVPTVPHHVL